MGDFRFVAHMVLCPWRKWWCPLQDSLKTEHSSLKGMLQKQLMKRVLSKGWTQSELQTKKPKYPKYHRTEHFKSADALQPDFACTTPSGMHCISTLLITQQHLKHGWNTQRNVNTARKNGETLSFSAWGTDGKLVLVFLTGTQMCGKLANVRAWWGPEHLTCVTYKWMLDLQIQSLAFKRTGSSSTSASLKLQWLYIN